MKYDVLSAIEASYRYDGDETAWLAGILAALKPFERGFGATAISFVVQGGAVRIVNAAGTGPASEVLADQLATWTSAPPHGLCGLIAPGVVLGTKLWGNLPEATRRQLDAILKKTRTIDALSVVARDHDDRGTRITFPVAPHRARPRAPTPHRHRGGARAVARARERGLVARGPL